MPAYPTLTSVHDGNINSIRQRILRLEAKGADVPEGRTGNLMFRIRHLSQHADAQSYIRLTD